MESSDKANTTHYNLAMTLHSDKAKGNNVMLAEFMEGKTVYEQQKLVFQTLGMANVYG